MDLHNEVASSVATAPLIKEPGSSPAGQGSEPLVVKANTQKALQKVTCNMSFAKGIKHPALEHIRNLKIICRGGS